MSSINKVILIGRLGQDPEVKSLSGGQNVATFTLATSETWKDKDNGQKQEKTEWHRIVAWGKLADLAKNYMTKGKLIYLEGKLQTRAWDDKTGAKRYTTEILANTIQFLSTAASTNTGANPSAGMSSSAHSSSNMPSMMDVPMPPTPPMGNFSSEELPF